MTQRRGVGLKPAHVLVIAMGSGQTLTASRRLEHRPGRPSLTPRLADSLDNTPVGSAVTTDGNRLPAVPAVDQGLLHLLACLGELLG